MQTKCWCVHFGDGTRLEVEAQLYWAPKAGTLEMRLYPDEDHSEVVLAAAPGEWRYLHVVGEDGCQADKPKYELKRVLDKAAAESAQKPGCCAT